LWDVLRVVNLGDDLGPVPVPEPEPLLAPPAGKRWVMAWSSEDPQYGGSGTAAPETEEEGWFLNGQCTVVMRPVDVKDGGVRTRVKKSGTDERTFGGVGAARTADSPRAALDGVARMELPVLRAGRARIPMEWRRVWGTRTTVRTFHTGVGTIQFIV
jgi:hypothetical protein